MTILQSQRPRNNNLTKASRKKGIVKIRAYNNKPESGSLTKPTKFSARLTKSFKEDWQITTDKE